MKSVHVQNGMSHYDTVCNVLLGDDVDKHSKSWIWNSSYSNHIIIVHEPNTLSFVL